MKKVITISAVICAGALAVVTFSLTGSHRANPAADDVKNGWDAKWFLYNRSAKLIVQESTPTADQVNFWSRPQRADPDAPAPVQRGRAQPLAVGDVDTVHLRFKDADGEIVPALLCTPHGKERPFPVVIATHGYGSNKAQVCAQVAPALVKRGFAVLAADMPRHGERPGNPGDVMDRTDPLKAYQIYRQAVVDDRQLIDLAEQRGDLDTTNGVILVGYSMGSWISSVVGPADERVRAMVLMVGGATNIPPVALKVPQVAATDPRLAIRHFAGRPILMLNGRSDTVVTPAMTRLLWDAAPQPKQQIWYNSGHLLSERAYSDATEWIAQTARAAGIAR